MIVLKNESFWGIHYLCWIIWAVMLLWVFVPPNYALGRFKRKETQLDLLKKQLASGEINKKEFQEKEKTIIAK